jgi:hypothetical protein
MKYIISPITVFDNDHELWETYVGTNEEGMPLLYSAWGKTESESRISAQTICDLLTLVLY